MAYYRDLSLAVYGEKCFACRADDRELEAHHITSQVTPVGKNHSENNADNVVPLCLSCHRTLHRSDTLENDRLRLLRSERDAARRRRREKIATDGGTKTVTFKLNPELVDELDDEADEKGVTRSAYLRNIIESRHRADELEARVDELRNQLRNANQRIDASNELVREVERERTLAERKAGAGALTRLKWWATGMPKDDDAAT